MEIKREPSTYNSSGILAKELEDELMKFTKKDEDEHVVEQTQEVRCNSDADVDIIECSKSLGNEASNLECQDTTENSSSFESTSSGVDNIDPLDDSEALSEFCDDAASALDFSAFSEKLRMRRKKPSSHWRSFIQPLMWRCKWVELQMKRLERDAQYYGRELEAYSKHKQIQSDSTSEDGVKSIPFSQASSKSELLRRKKRRKEEATTDLGAYMSHHNLFSYYENKKSTCEAAVMANEIKNPVNQKVNIDDEFLVKEEFLNEPRDGDSSLENLLCKIYNLQSQVGKLKDRVDKVKSENAGSFPSTEDSVPCNASTSSNGERMAVGTYIASQLLSEYNMGDAHVAESAVMSHGNAPGANGRVEEGDLIDNQRVKDEMNSYAEVKIPLVPKEEVKNIEEEMSHSTSSNLVIKEEVGDLATTSVVTEPEPDLLLKGEPSSPQKLHSIVKFNAARGKRKRARRRGSARWSRRSTG